MYLLDDMEWLKQFSSLHLNPNQRRMLIFAKAHSNSFSSRDYQKVCGVDIYSAASEIKLMIKQGCLIHPRKGGRVYRIITPSQRVRMEKKEIPQEYEVLKRILDKQGHVKNQQIQEVLGIPRFKATRLVQRLIHLGMLELVGRGRGARYIKRIQVKGSALDSCVREFWGLSAHEFLKHLSEHYLPWILDFCLSRKPQA